MDPMKQFAEEDAKMLNGVNERRKSLGLEPFANLTEEVYQWERENPQGEGSAVEDEAVKPVNKEDSVKEQVKVADAVKSFSAPDVFKPSDANGGNAETEKLRQELEKAKSELGRWEVAKSEREQLKADLEAANRRAEEAERKALEASSKNADDAVLSKLTQEEIDELGGSQKAAAVVLKVVKEAIKMNPQQQPQKVDTGRVDEIQRRLEERDRKDYETRKSEMFISVSKTVPAEVYAKFSNDPKWSEWNQRSFGGIPYWQLYKSAVESLDGEAVIDLFQKFMRYAGIEIPAKGTKPPLRTENRFSAENVTQSADEPVTYRYEEILEKLTDWKKRGKLPSGWTQKQFMDKADEWDVAAANGRVIDASGNARRELPVG